MTEPALAGSDWQSRLSPTVGDRGDRGRPWRPWATVEEVKSYLNRFIRLKIVGSKLN